MIEIRTYNEGDYEAITDPVEVYGGKGDFSMIADIGVYLTVTDCGIPVGCGGAVYLTEEEGEIWLKLSKKFAKKPITMLRIFREGFRIIEESFGFDRLIAKVQEGFKEGERLVEKFGFVGTPETTKEMGLSYRIYEKCQPDYS